MGKLGWGFPWVRFCPPPLGLHPMNDSFEKIVTADGDYSMEVRDRGTDSVSVSVSVSVNSTQYSTVQ